MYELGSSINVTCSSDLTVQLIRWLNMSNDMAIIGTGEQQQQLFLEINRATTDINNTMYLCEVTIVLPNDTTINITEMFTLEVSSKSIYYDNDAWFELLYAIDI